LIEVLPGGIAGGLTPEAVKAINRTLLRTMAQISLYGGDFTFIEFPPGGTVLLMVPLFLFKGIIKQCSTKADKV
jgi:hypothetical protein